jgi:Raf kinase inhibitor-like YbhB/YbcL family protein
MNHSTAFFASMAIAAAAVAAVPAFAANLKVTVEKHEAGNRMPSENASCVGTPDGKSAQGTNKSPAVSWSKGPQGTRSYALTMVDSEVAVDNSGSNKEGVSIPVNAKRHDFVHWVLADIPATMTGLAAGADANGVVKGGLPLETTDHGRRGQNGVSEGGYKGPCPPWNDERFHQYHITVYALDVDRLDLPASFMRADLLKAMKGHILASDSTTLRFATNAKAKD